ncbi:C40 family peptidase [Kitasatospora sp. NPDC051853]|uniref:C40 family peptidase n=1 Tax=Kitasatospora sp. NPDC051853 TaxID=3364058 RepID=UPI0037A32A3A
MAMNLPVTILVLGGGVAMIWVGIQDPDGGLVGEIGRVLRGEPSTRADRTSTSAASAAAAILATNTPGSAGTGSGSPTSVSTGGGGSGGGVLAVAKSQMGLPYVWGGGNSSGPTGGGFDCSGLLQFAYAKGAGISIPRVAAAQQSAAQRITEAEAVPGDAVFFGAPAYHCGIVAGGGQMVHAPHTGTVVKLAPISAVRPGPITYGRYRKALET